MGCMVKGLEFKSQQGQYFSSLHVIHTGSDADAASHSMGTGGYFPASQAAKV
jgi:hypothetical protein